MIIRTYRDSTPPSCSSVIRSTTPTFSLVAIVALRHTSWPARHVTRRSWTYSSGSNKHWRSTELPPSRRATPLRRVTPQSRTWNNVRGRRTRRGIVYEGCSPRSNDDEELFSFEVSCWRTCRWNHPLLSITRPSNRTTLSVRVVLRCGRPFDSMECTGKVQVVASLGWGPVGIFGRPSKLRRGALSEIT